MLSNFIVCDASPLTLQQHTMYSAFFLLSHSTHVSGNRCLLLCHRNEANVTAMALQNTNDEQAPIGADLAHVSLTKRGRW